MGSNLDAAVLLSEGLEPLDLVARCSVEIQSEKRGPPLARIARSSFNNGVRSLDVCSLR
jgi:hypothetical protein